MHVCICVCLCVWCGIYTHVHRCACQCTGMWRPEDSVKYPLSFSSIFLRQSFSLNLELHWQYPLLSLPHKTKGFMSGYWGSNPNPQAYTANAYPLGHLSWPSDTLCLLPSLLDSVSCILGFSRTLYIVENALKLLNILLGVTGIYH